MYVATSVVGWKSKSKLKRELMISSFSGAFNYYFRNCIGAIFSWKNSEEWFNAFDKAVTGFPESGYYIVPSGGASSKYFTPMAKDIFLPTKLLPFDDIVVNVPNKPEMHCEMEYGDWRQIPPDNMRWQHFIKEISFSVSN